MAVATKRPDRVIGFHFFNPAQVMKLVELVHTVATDPEVVEEAKAFAEQLGKTPVACRDRAGFIANVLLFPYMNSAVRLFEQRFASREDIDASMQLGIGHPMGPLATARPHRARLGLRDLRGAVAPVPRHDRTRRLRC